MWRKERLHRTESFRCLIVLLFYYFMMIWRGRCFGGTVHNGSWSAWQRLSRSDWNNTAIRFLFLQYFLKFVFSWPALIWVELQRHHCQQHSVMTVQDHGLEPSEGMRASNRAVNFITWNGLFGSKRLPLWLIKYPQWKQSALSIPLYS